MGLPGGRDPGLLCRVRAAHALDGETPQQGFRRRGLTASTLGLEVDRTRSPREAPPFGQATLSGLEKCLIKARVSNNVKPENAFDLSWDGAGAAA